MNENDISGAIVDSSLRIHQQLGPGLLESVYEAVLAADLVRRGLAVQRQVPVRIAFDGLQFDEGFRADLIVNGLVIVELKSVQALTDAHKKQLLTYVKLSGCRVGLLLNFGEALMKNGIVRIVNKMEDETGRLRVSAPPRENEEP